ncbi:PAS domain-containing hybrid sensor histidine kinase/response regulator [Paremcibacter congregatus]|uniref:histidine kinase n=1 Tax=Paremcibacter congregatus TaxID=2043170 RepID=A0A2G4YUE1_9PROT|nr:PAS domain-containing hybrid sensor histidine kinase/response regulator [Paremcibacter congregatus]PHZ85945.1 histidine kinase [Paremcibacter congregatus]QDE26910.1 response regulator [Paremcibacter congregatus]
MLQTWVIITVSLGYVGLLFAIAYWGDKRSLERPHNRYRSVIYSLTLAVYCTSWAFYGTSGQTAATGWIMAPTYLGSIIVLVLAWPFLIKMITVAKKQNITSIADFLSSRYGKSQQLAILVTLVATMGVVPYIALQLKAVSTSFNVLTGQTILDHNTGTIYLFEDTAIFVAGLMALFTILFGTRHIKSNEHHEGMMLAIAFESIVKLTAFTGVGLFITYGLFDGFGDITARIAQNDSIQAIFTEGNRHNSFLTSVVLGMTAIFCLPRQFHVLVVENSEPGDIRLTRWLFPIYLIGMSLFIFPIAAAGLLTPSAGSNQDLYILTLPLTVGRTDLALLAFIGGLSAATSMVIVGAVALSTMVSNDVVMPIILRLKWLRLDERKDISWLLLTIRRITIVAIMFLAYFYYRMVVSFDALASIGLLSMVLAAQFAPAIVGGLYWKGATHRGAMGGICIGFALWCFTLLVPLVVRAGWISPDILDNGLFGLSLLRPESLFGVQNMTPVTHGLIWSLGANVMAFVLLSRLSRHTLIEHIQAATYVDSGSQIATEPGVVIRSSAKVSDLMALGERFVGVTQARQAFSNFAAERGEALSPNQPAHDDLVLFTEHLLAGAIGSATARVVINTGLQGREIQLDDFVSIVDEASEVFQANRTLLQKSLENVNVGISVVDKDLHLVAWNKCYLDMFDYPEGFIYAGRYIGDVLAHNATQGLFGTEQIDLQIQKRLDHLSRGTKYSVERTLPNGRVIEIHGRPLPGGGFVTSYSDITTHKQAADTLLRANEILEQRVTARTGELMAAKAEAEQANISKTRFLAAASHDLLQPLNAARLFTSALTEKTTDNDIRPLINHLDSSLNAVEGLLDGLLEISKLDAGVLRPDLRDFALMDLLTDLDHEFTAIARDQGIAFKMLPTKAIVHSDPKLLRRVLQNFISNAIRYTDQGRVLVGGRISGPDRITLQVYDTGCGISEHKLDEIFIEFKQLNQKSEVNSKEQGLGLGLAIVERICRLLDHSLTVNSTPGKGSVFSIGLPLSTKKHLRKKSATAAKKTPANRLVFADLHILCIDNDPDILTGMQALLSNWGCRVTCCRALDDVAGTSANGKPDIILADYHLDKGKNGIDALNTLQIRMGGDIPGIVISADYTEDVKRQAEEHGYKFLRKPLKAAALRALINSQVIYQRPKA